VINAITHCSSVFLWERLFFTAKEELDKLDPELTDMYQSFSRLANSANWYVNENMARSVKNMSMVKLTFNDGVWNIHCTGANIPLLFHEASKGVMELLSYWGLQNIDRELDEVDENFIPVTERKLSKREAELMLNVADDYNHERWYYYMGPAIWVRLLEVWDTTPDQVSFKLQELYQLEPEQFMRTVHSLVYDQKEINL
jgi:hypothetical protein